MLVNTIVEGKVGQLWDVAKRLAMTLDATGIPYRVIGGFAIFVHVDRVDPIAARVTRDVDVAIERNDLDRIIKAIEPHGLKYRHTAGIDTLVEAERPRASTAVHLVFVNEKVRPEYVEPVPGFSDPVRTAQGVLIAPVADLVRMKLTSFRLKDRVHVQDMDSVGLITPEIEASLSEPLRARLAEVRATE
ncbi:MAG: hypothetical protein LAO79_26475 [Acidobacteriia bacterium]|nr:hypothetical protein [Terriglobia bacterium]